MAGVIKTIADSVKSFFTGEIYEPTDPSKRYMDAEVEAYNSGDGWRWRVVSKNGDVISNGLQGYSRAIDMRRGMELTAGAIAQYGIDRVAGSK